MTLFYFLLKSSHFHMHDPIRYTHQLSHILASQQQEFLWWWWWSSFWFSPKCRFRGSYVQSGAFWGFKEAEFDFFWMFLRQQLILRSIFLFNYFLNSINAMKIRPLWRDLLQKHSFDMSKSTNCWENIKMDNVQVFY